MDNKLFLYLNKLSGRSKAGNFIISVLATYLAFVLIYVFLFSLIEFELFAHKPLTVITSVLFASIFSRFIVGGPLQYLLKRTRPHKVHNIHNVLTAESFSFPSGHSLFFFAFATIVFCFNPLFGIFFFLGVCIMTLFRVIAGVHYPSDILSGMLIGIVIGFLTFYLITPFLHQLFYS